MQAYMFGFESEIIIEIQAKEPCNKLQDNNLDSREGISGVGMGVGVGLQPPMFAPSW